MTPEIMWSILIAMGAITIAAVLKVVEYARKLHLSDQELSSSREELNAIKSQHNQSVSELQQLHTTEKEKLTERIADLEKKLKSSSSQHFNPAPKGPNSWMA